MEAAKQFIVICVVSLLVVLSAGAQAEVAVYNFDDGTLQGWVNDAAATEDMVAWDTTANTNGGRTVARSADYMVLEINFGDRDSDTNVKILTSPEFLATAGTAIEIWTLGGTGSVDVPTWSNIADMPTSAGADFMGIALRRVSDGEYLLFDRRSAGGQSGRTISWLAVGWDAAEIATAVAGDSATEIYVVDIIDAYSGGWGWIGVDDATLTDVTIVYSKAHDPMPYAGESMINTSGLQLEWLAPDAYTVTGYDVYLDPNEANVINGDISVRVSANQPGTTLTPAPELDSEVTYYWRVDAYEQGVAQSNAGDVWTFTTAPHAPYIVMQPESLTVTEDDSAVFTVEQNNGTSFQWSYNGVEITGATAATYTVANVSKADEGFYTCNISNAVLPAGIDTDPAGLWTKRLMGHWTFDNTLTDTVDAWAGVYTDPNTANTPPSVNYDDEGISGKSIRFEEDELYVEVAGSEDFFNFYPQGYTASAWVKTADWGAIVSKEIPGYSNGWALTTHQGTGTHTLRSYGDLHGTMQIVDDVWHLVTITLDVNYDAENPDAKMLRLFVDGVQERQAVYNGQIPLSSAPLLFGIQTTASANPLAGLIDEVKIWSYAVDPFDIAKMYTDVMTDEYVCVGLPAMDFNGDCVTDLLDFAEFAAAWLDCTRVAGATSGEIDCYGQN